MKKGEKLLAKGKHHFTGGGGNLRKGRRESAVGNKKRSAPVTEDGRIKGAKN